MRLRYAAPLALLALGLLIRLGGGLSAAETKEVQIDNYSFTPGTLTVPVGTTVTWTNHDETPHTSFPPTHRAASNPAASTPTTSSP